jgi:Zn-dependent protease with chaperone function
MEWAAENTIQIMSFNPSENRAGITRWIGFLAVLSFAHPASIDQNPQSHRAPTSVAPGGAMPATESMVASPGKTVGTEPLTAYTLSPDREAKARALSKVRLRLRLLGIAWGLLLLALILRFRLAVYLRDFVERATRRKILQLLIFAPLLLFAISVFTLPLGIYGAALQRAYGLSIQSWPSWAADWAKGALLSALVSTLFIGLLYFLIHRSPRRWWLWFYLASLPLILLGFFLNPLVIDPLFHRFEPLQESRPALSREMLRMVQRAGVDIPEHRFFLMRASEKTTALNAYVTGFGGSKRIVMWDTLTSAMDAPQVLFVASHELGHYVLRHIAWGLLLSALGLFIALALAFLLAEPVLRRWGPAWGIRGLGDWASLPVILLFVSLLSTLGGPMANVFSRHVEREADRYALEVMHGLVPDASQAGARAFNKLGEVNLSDPAPSALRVLLFYTHPPVAERIRFCLEYDPWRKGGAPVYVR